MPPESQKSSHSPGVSRRPLRPSLLLLAGGWLLSGCGEHTQEDVPFVFGGAPSQGSASGSGQTSAGTAPAAGGDAPVGGGTAGNGGTAGDTSAVWQSDGCGKPFTGAAVVPTTIATSGTKDPMCSAKLAGVPKCGPWSLEREYNVYLPTNYDSNKPYPLVFEAPGCSGNGGGVYDLPNIRDAVIRIGLTPPPKSIGHATNPDQGCFDDKEGDDSVDFVFYETLYDELNRALCFDRNRVHAVGDGSGGWLANELGCKYAGDPNGRPIRSVVSNRATLPNQPEYSPTCTNQPMAGFWVYKVEDLGGTTVRPSYAVSRAMQVNGCTGASDWNDAVSKGRDFPIGAGNADNVCKQIEGCPELYPLVVCPLPGPQQQPNFGVIEPGASVFIKKLTAP